MKIIKIIGTILIFFALFTGIFVSLQKYNKYSLNRKMNELHTWLSHQKNISIYDLHCYEVNETRISPTYPLCRFSFHVKDHDSQQNLSIIRGIFITRRPFGFLLDSWIKEGLNKMVPAKFGEYGYMTDYDAIVDRVPEAIIQVNFRKDCYGIQVRTEISGFMYQGRVIDGSNYPSLSGGNEKHLDLKYIEKYIHSENDVTLRYWYDQTLFMAKQIDQEL